MLTFNKCELVKPIDQLSIIMRMVIKRVDVEIERVEQNVLQRYKWPCNIIKYVNCLHTLLCIFPGAGNICMMFGV